MKKIVFFVILFQGVSTQLLFAQSKQKLNAATKHGVQVIPLLLSTSKTDILKRQWNITYTSMRKEEEFMDKSIEAIKYKNQIDKLKSNLPTNTHTQQSKKVRGTMPTIGVKFEANQLYAWTPTDNSISVSRGGKIVSCDNQGIEYYESNGTPIAQYLTWADFINNTAFPHPKFDPRTIYDPIHDKFIVVFLHASKSWLSKIFVAFSKTNDPMLGWNIYTLPGNPLNDSSWTDFPTIGINENELFVAGNLFGDNYYYNQSIIHQINLEDGYAGNPLHHQFWSNISAPDGFPGLTMCPASNGLGDSMHNKMYFVSNKIDSGSAVYLFEITNKMSAADEVLNSYSYPIPHYEVCANCFIKDPITGIKDSLSTGTCWIQNAYYLNNKLHFTFDANNQVTSGWCGINYGRIDLTTQTASTIQYAQVGTDMCYPAIASMGYDSLDKSALICFVRADTNTLPETDVIAIDDNMNWSARQTVKTGDTIVNILGTPTMPFYIYPERWGDYSGAHRRVGVTPPEVWVAGSISANAYKDASTYRNASYVTWVAQVTTADAPVATTTITSPDNNVTLYPNPAREMFSVDFYNDKEGEISIDIIDMTGRLVKNIAKDYVQKNNIHFMFNKLMLPNGNYVITIKRNKIIVSSQKLTIRD